MFYGLPIKWNCLQEIFSIGYKEKRSPYSPDKRKFFTRLFIGVIGLSEFLRAQVKVIPKKDSTVPIIKIVYPSPPGSLTVEHFYSSCTACHLCVAACPTHVMQPSFLEHGVFNILQPYLDNSAAYCTFECVRCTEVVQQEQYFR